jgi:hypothetical protein
VLASTIALYTRDWLQAPIERSAVHVPVRDSLTHTLSACIQLTANACQDEERARMHILWSKGRGACLRTLSSVCQLRHAFHACVSSVQSLLILPHLVSEENKYNTDSLACLQDPRYVGKCLRLQGL